MFRNPVFATVLVTAYLLLYCILFSTDAGEGIITAMFLASPFLLVWLAVTILKDGKYTGPELGADEEWGYGDKNKNSTGIF